MTPAQIQQKLNDLRTKKAQIDEDISAMAASVDEALKPIRENRSKLNHYWGEWKATNQYTTRERWIGEKKGETRVRVIFQARLGKDLAEAYLEAVEAAPKAIKNIDELIGDLLDANDRLQKAKASLVGVQIPSSVSNVSQLSAINTSLNSAKMSSNQAIDSARAILTSLPDRRKKINPLISAALKVVKIVLDRLNKKEDKLEDRKITLTPEFKKLRLKLIDLLQKKIKPYYEMAKKIVKEADDFVDSAPAREQSLKSKQLQLNNSLSSIQSGLSFSPGGSPNRSTVSPGSAALHLLAIGSVAAGICAFDYLERRA
jgi:chromosome segregation ATPase